MSDSAAPDELVLAYGETAAVERLSLGIRKGGRVALPGASGRGKTTTGRAIASLLAPRCGTIRPDGRNPTRVPPSTRGVGLVFQYCALFPHLTVYEKAALASPIFRRGCSRVSGRSRFGRSWRGRPPSSPAGSGSASHWRGPS